MLIKIEPNIHIAADQIASVYVNNHRQVITITTKTGDVFSIGADYGKGIYETCYRLVKEINAHLTAQQGEDDLK